MKGSHKMVIERVLVAMRRGSEKGRKRRVGRRGKVHCGN